MNLIKLLFSAKFLIFFQFLARRGLAFGVPGQQRVRRSWTRNLGQRLWTGRRLWRLRERPQLFDLDPIHDSGRIN